MFIQNQRLTSGDKTTNQGVVGSNPASRAKFRFCLMAHCLLRWAILLFRGV